MELEGVDACLPSKARHLRWWCIDEHADREHGLLGHSRAGRRDAGSRNRGGDLPSRWSKDEPDQIRSGGSRGRGVLRFAQAVDLDDVAPGKQARQSLRTGVYLGHANSAWTAATRSDAVMSPSPT